MKKTLSGLNIIVLNLILCGIFFCPNSILAQDEEEESELPEIDRSALVGGTTVKGDGDFIETRIMGYCAMKTAARAVAGEIQSKLNRDGSLNRTLVVYNESDIKTLSRYTTMMNRLRILETGYRDIIGQLEREIRNIDPTYPLPTDAQIRSFLEEQKSGEKALGPAAIIQSALDVLSLFKTDIELTPREFDIGEKELVAEVFRNLRSFNLYYPKTIPLNIEICRFSTLQECSPLMDKVVQTGILNDRANHLVGQVKAAKEAQKAKFQEIRELRDELNNTTTPVNAQRREQILKEIAELEKETVGLNEQTLENQIIKLEQLKNRHAASNELIYLNKVFNLTIEELGLKQDGNNGDKTGSQPECPDKTCSQQTTTVNVNVGTEKPKEESGGAPNTKFVSYLQAESIYRVMKDPNSYWIDLNVIKAGGSLRIKSNIITNFLFGSRVNFSGGSIVYYSIFDNTGKALLGGVLPAYEKYRKSSRIVPQCQ
jgi:hypothetical protein